MQCDLTHDSHNSIEFAHWKDYISLDAEITLVGGLLHQTDALDEIQAILLFNDIYNPSIRSLYKTILAMVKDGEEVNLLTLAERLKRDFSPDDLPELFTLASSINSTTLEPTHGNWLLAINVLMDSVPGKIDVLRSAEIIVEKSCNRQIHVCESNKHYDDLQQAIERRTAIKQGWGEPEPITSTLPNVMPMTVDMLPDVIAPWLMDAAERMQCPPDFVAVSAVVSLAATVGTACGVRPKKLDNWHIVPNLWGGVVGSPSILKTPSLSEGEKPLERLEAEAQKDFQNAISDHEIDCEIYEAKRDTFKKDIKKSIGNEVQLQRLRDEFNTMSAPEKPLARRYVVKDGTIEKIGELANQNERGLLLFRDELFGWLSSLERDDRQQDRAFYLEAFNGDGGFTVDRIGRGTMYIKNLCLSVLGCLTRDKLSNLLKTASKGGNDGLVQRLQLFVYPDAPKAWRYIDRPPDRAAKERAFAIFKILAEADFSTWGAAVDDYDDTVYMRFANDAQAVFIDWLHDLQAKIANDNDDDLIREHLGKYRSLFPSLALIFHLVDMAEAQNKVGQISLSATMKAFYWCEYLESHARRIYATAANQRLQAITALAGKLKRGALPDGFTVRDVYRKGWKYLDDYEFIDKALHDLMAKRWLHDAEPHYVGTGRKPSTKYFINPKLKKAQNA